MATTDSSYQNTYEYLAILLGLLLSKRLGLRDGEFAVLGDSRSSLAWVLQGRARSVLCRRASIDFSILALNEAAAILETEYVPSKLNAICDGLSRGVRQVLTYAVIRRAVKAGAMRLGVDPTMFSLHSLRIGGACALRAAMTLFMGRWKSAPACLSYQEVGVNEYDRAMELLHTRVTQSSNTRGDVDSAGCYLRQGGG